MTRVLSSLLFALAFVTLSSGQTSGTRDLLGSFLSQAKEPLTQYRAYRTMEASGKFLGERKGLVEIETELLDGKFKYQVMYEKGSGYVIGKLIEILEKEKEFSKKPEESEFSTENYLFSQDETQNEITKILAAPKRKADLLLAGTLFLNSAGELVRAEGTLVKSPDASLSDAKVITTYARIFGVRVPLSVTTTAQARVALLIKIGVSLQMRYTYTSINGVDVPR